MARLSGHMRCPAWARAQHGWGGIGASPGDTPVPHVPSPTRNPGPGLRGCADLQGTSIPFSVCGEIDVGICIFRFPWNSRLPCIAVALGRGTGGMAATNPSVDELEKREEELYRTGPLSVLTTSVKTNSQARRPLAAVGGWAGPGSPACFFPSPPRLSAPQHPWCRSS